MSEYQTHGVNLVFDGTFQDLIATMEAAGFQIAFYPPGLNGSQGTVIIEKTPEQTELDNAIKITKGESASK